METKIKKKGALHVKISWNEQSKNEGNKRILERHKTNEKNKDIKKSRTKQKS